MKTKIKFYYLSFFSSLVFAIILVFAGCTKDFNGVNKALPENNNTSHYSNLKDGGEQHLQLLYRIWNPSLMDYQYWCAPPAIDCLSEVVITPPPPQGKSIIDLSLIYERFLISLEEGTINEFFKDSESG